MTALTALFMQIEHSFCRSSEGSLLCGAGAVEEDGFGLLVSDVDDNGLAAAIVGFGSSGGAGRSGRRGLVEVLSNSDVVVVVVGPVRSASAAACVPDSSDERNAAKGLFAVPAVVRSDDVAGLVVSIERRAKSLVSAVLLDGSGISAS